jgi:chromosome segregation ATPase
MGEQRLLSRIGTWFRRGHAEAELPVRGEITPGEPRSVFLRPWARRDAAISNLQEGFQTLTELMSSIRTSLEQNSVRQDELLSHLSQLPQLFQQLPESSRMQGEALRAIHQQLSTQSQQQDRLAEILDRLTSSGTDQKHLLDEIQNRISTLTQTDQAIADNLSTFGTAMQSVSRNSAESTGILEQMRQRMSERDGQLELILHRQNTRFTTMLSIAIFLSIAALTCVCVVGYLLLTRPA